MVRKSPGLTEAELAEAILGRGARQQRVNPSCRELYQLGRIDRRGYGGSGDPFRYYPVQKGGA